MSDQPPSTLRTPQRAIRVFISSTFPAMQADTSLQHIINLVQAA